MQGSLELLEWPTLFNHLLEECLTPYGLDAWKASPFLTDADAVESHQLEVEGLKTLLIRYGDVTLDKAWNDIRPALRRLAKAGLLTLTELRHLLRTLREGSTLLRHFSKMLKSESSSLAYLSSLLDEELIPAEAHQYLLKHFEPGGDLRDDASPRLLELRRTFSQRQHALQRQIQAILQKPEFAQALQSPTVTERDGRLVVPVKVEFKNRLPGVIHGASASGSTLFVEPEALVSLNNDMQALQASIQQEIERLVAVISTHLHEDAGSLQSFVDGIGALDRRLAAARLSRKLDANPVVLSDELLIDVRQARHPLLLLNRRSQKQTIIANDIRIGIRPDDASHVSNPEDSPRTLLITGPNTGGKTVLLKTVGLYACMLRAGLHLPVAEGSRMALFSQVLADIGDQQDLAQDLSTFSAHLQTLKNIVADETDLSRALVLIDEIAAGTDPVEGAAIAKAVLHEIYRKGAISIVTTHLGELKTEAHRHPGFMNASMAFDTDTLSPTYRLLLGVPGASNAITIAERLGLKASVIQGARAALGAPSRESADLLQELETRNYQAQVELETARSYREESQVAWEKLEAERQRFDAERRQTLKQFQVSLKSRLNELEERLKNWRRDMTLAETQQSDGSKLDELTGKIRAAGRKADQIFANARASLEQAPTLPWDSLQIGMKVFSRQLELTGEITKLLPSTQEVVLQSGILRMTVPVDDLDKPRKNPHKGASKPRQPRQLDRPARISDSEVMAKALGLPTAITNGMELGEMADPSQVCDVRGQRGEEAIESLAKFLDTAILEGVQAIAVVHGLGTGALKRQIRQYLSTSTYVQKYYPAQATRGGDGKTIVELKDV